ncbi:Cytoplasmic FMR1-interacting protein 2 [Coelomomyces lativittatus]|nr:Cytoplasmic FMR1-interacting protein 2 [Coelomomyces lativittatus]
MNTLHSSTKTANSRGAIQPSQLVKTYINAEACSSVIAPNTLLIPKPNLPLSHILNFDFLELDYFKKEVNWIEQLENILKDSKKYLSLVYAYRGCISAIPSYSTITPTSAVEEESKADFYRLVEEIMQPEMQKIKDVMVFFDTSMATVFIILNEVCLGLSQNAPTEYFFYTIAKVLDMFLVLDSLKNMKVSLNNDFTLIFRRSRSLSKNQSGDDFENQKLYLFLANKDVFYTKLKTLIPTYTGIEDFFWELVNVLLDRFERGYYMSSADQFSLLKSIAFALLLLDPFLTPKNMAQKKWKMDRFNKVFRGNLVVHLYGDLILEIPGILSKTTVYKWEFPAIPTYVPDIVALRNEYSCLLAQITLDIQEVEKFEGKEMSEEFSKSMYERLLKGLKLISTLTGAALQMNTYKYAKPTNHNINPNCPPNALNYEQAIRYNYTQADKLLLLELLSMVKIGAEKLIRAEVILLPVARRYLYSIFSTYQTSLLPELLRNVNKKRKSNYPYLTTLMSMANAVMNPPESYVAQGLIGRIYKLNALSGGFMKDKDLKDSQWIELDIYHELLYWSPIILDFTNHIRLTSDLGALWCKEFYLELSKQIQFPIETSLPWMLIQQALSPTSTLDLTQTLFIPFLIYDDAANSALTELKLQFIYNEIEAEANLAFDLFLSQYSNMVFQHFKCKAASSLLPESYRKLYGKEKAEEFIYRRHEDVLSKFKTIHILGRCIHFNDIMAHFLNLAIRNSFEAILSRFESTSLHGVIELHCLLQILQVTHEELSKYVPLDAYETIFMEIDERNVGHGRILAHIVSELLVVASSHTYNATSDKFLLSPVVVFPIDHLVRGAGKHPKHEYLFGNKYFAQMFQGKLAPFQSSIGMDHFKAIVELLGPRVTVVVNELTDHFKYSVTG